MARRKARELAFRTLFQAERGGSDLGDVWHLVRSELGEPDERDDIDAETYGAGLETEDLRFASELLDAFASHRTAIDDELERVVEGWTFNQMAQTDLNILRLALTELRHFDTPGPVVIEVAVRLAKRFGGEQSGRFVNGVLGRALDGAPEPTPAGAGG